MRFQIYKKPHDGKYYFKLKAKNGWPLLLSLPHDNPKAVRRTIDKVRKNALDDDQYDRKIAKNQRYYYEIKDDKKTTIAVSRFYRSERYLKRAMQRVKKTAPVATVVEKSPFVKNTRIFPKQQEMV